MDRTYHGEHRLLVYISHRLAAWWHHEIKTLSALMSRYVGNAPIIGEVLSKRACNMDHRMNVIYWKMILTSLAHVPNKVTAWHVMLHFLPLNKLLNDQLSYWWFETWSHLCDIKIRFSICSVNFCLCQDDLQHIQRNMDAVHIICMCCHDKVWTDISI